MLSVWEDVLLVLFALAAALVLLTMLNRVWSRESRRAHNDLVGWQLSILGTTYAVILGFMLYTVWTNFTLADLNVDLEASAAVDLYRLADGLPEAQRIQLQQQTLQYVETAVHKDWPAMADSQIPDQTMSLSADMWRTLMSVKAATPNEITAEDHAISELSSLNEHRRTRILQSTSRLPGVLWWVLIAGGIMTITSACLFGATSTQLHAIQVSSLALLIALVLVAIADIHRPFQGAVHVRSYAFERAQANMLER